MEKSEKEIIERLNAKDKQAFEYVFIQFYNSLCYFADKYVCDKSTVSVDFAPPTAAWTVQVPVYENRFKNDLPSAMLPTISRVTRWSRKMPVSKYEPKSHSNTLPDSCV